MSRNQKLVFEWVVAGFSSDCSFRSGHSWSPGSPRGGRRCTCTGGPPALLVINLVPFIFVLVTLAIGGAQAKLVELKEQTAALAERVAHEWNEEIHGANVATASAAAAGTDRPSGSSSKRGPARNHSSGWLHVGARRLSPRGRYAPPGCVDRGRAAYG